MPNGVSGERRKRANALMRTRPVVRSGLVAANSIIGSPDSEAAIRVARSLSAASSTAPMSSIQACIAGSRVVSIESEAPHPRRSHVIRRPQADKRRRPRAAIRIVPKEIDRRGRTRRKKDVAIGAVHHLIRDVIAIAQGVLSLGHRSHEPADTLDEPLFKSPSEGSTGRDGENRSFDHRRCGLSPRDLPRGRVASMAEILLFHHAQGQTEGFLAFADELRAAGHVVHAPDLYDGKTFAELADGVSYAQQVGFDTIIERGRLAADSLPNELVYARFSLGVPPAQMLAQTRPGSKGALLFHSCVPTSEFGRPWPQGVPLQIHMMDADEWVLPPNEDLDIAHQLAETIESAELFLYPGDRHLFADNSLPDYDESATTMLKQRVLSFLDDIE